MISGYSSVTNEMQIQSFTEKRIRIFNCDAIQLKNSGILHNLNHIIGLGTTEPLGIILF